MAATFKVGLFLTFFVVMGIIPLGCYKAPNDPTIEPTHNSKYEITADYSQFQKTGLGIVEVFDKETGETYIIANGQNKIQLLKIK